MANGGALAALLLLGTLLGGACQPVDRLELEEDVAPAHAGARDGAAVPATLAELLEQGARTAQEWQREPVVAEVAVALDEQGWRRARLLYLAPGADRFLSLRFEGARVSQERVTLTTLGLEPVPADGMTAIPSFPEDALEPAALIAAAAEHLAGCLEGSASDVIYDTGAPAAWDGSRWTETPVWTATIWRAAGDGGGEGARVDPATGEPALDDFCVTV